MAIYYGDVPLPDGRICQAKLYGAEYPNTFWEPGYYDIREEDPLKVTWMDGVEFTEEEYTEFEEYIIEWLLKHGSYESWTPDD